MVTEQKHRMSGNMRITADVLSAGAGGLIAGFDRANGPVPGNLEVLREAQLLKIAADMRVHEIVGAARRNGATWEAVGQALGISRQAAQQKYRRRP